MYRYLPTIQQARCQPRPKGPTRTLPEFAEMKGVDWRELASWARRHPLPKAWNSGAKTQNRYEVRELKTWFAAVRGVQ